MCVIEIYLMTGRSFLPGHLFFTKSIAIGKILLYNNNALLCALIDTLILERKPHMELWQKYLLAAGIGLLLLILAIRRTVRKNRDYKNRSFTRKLETVLQPRENIKVICPQKHGQVILTTRRLLFDTPKGFQAVPLKTIKRVQGLNADYKKTAVVENMTRILVKAEKEHTVSGGTPEFTQLAKQLIRKVESQNRKKKAQKEQKSGKK